LIVQNTLESQASLFSMTSKMGVVVDQVARGSQRVGLAKTVTIESPNGHGREQTDSPSPGKPASFSPVIKRSAQRQHLHRLNTVACVQASSNDILPAVEDSNSLESAFSWVCHSDVIQSMVVLREDACIITNSLDGFHRVWNLHQECLGENYQPVLYCLGC
jgi:WD40 repeat protein